MFLLPHGIYVAKICLRRRREDMSGFQRYLAFSFLKTSETPGDNGVAHGFKRPGQSKVECLPLNLGFPKHVFRNI